jgi:abnormal spindle-like microcephaly-associated protein
LTSSYSDGKALCFIINFYFPEALPLSQVKPTTRDMKKKSEGTEDEAASSSPPQPSKRPSRWVATFSPPSGKSTLTPQLRAALDGEKHNFALVQEAVKAAGFIPPIVRSFVDFAVGGGSLPDEKVRLRLEMEHQRLVSAATLIQSVIRMMNARKDFETTKTAAVTLQRAWVAVRDRRDFVALKDATIKIQSIARMVIAKREFQSTQSKIIRVQALARGVLARH